MSLSGRASPVAHEPNSLMSAFMANYAINTQITYEYIPNYELNSVEYHYPKWKQLVIQSQDFISKLL